MKITLHILYQDEHIATWVVNGGKSEALDLIMDLAAECGYDTDLCIYSSICLY